ncbi:hypothetical protein ACFFX0_28505 [Citricoccus parietis]|uniref:Uncharacterized protein n=1 Tax=Citricoccus parietis TaxID=592307 RepID=A0ABV5FTW2_9MICC
MASVAKDHSGLEHPVVQHHHRSSAKNPGSAYTSSAVHGLAR